VTHDVAIPVLANEIVAAVTATIGALPTEVPQSLAQLRAALLVALDLE
jgi:hypothetical protein